LEALVEYGVPVDAHDPRDERSGEKGIATDVDVIVRR